MAQGYDFAIVGSSPLAALLAGVLAHDHRKQVLSISAAVSPLRLPRSLDLALPFATRPETWRLLQRTTAETLRLLASIDLADAVQATRVAFVADRPDTQSALAHMVHVAAAYGVDMRRVPRLIRPAPLDGSSVARVEASRASLVYGRSGAAELAVDGEVAEVGQVILADDAAILEHLRERPPALVAEAMTATLTAPAKRLAAPVMRFLDRGVTLVQRPDLAVLALVAGDRDVDARLAASLPGPFPLPRRATSHFHRLGTTDGAPLIRRVDPSNLFIVAGLGDAGAFLAPALARFLVGAPDPEESAWLTAHDGIHSRLRIAEPVA